MCRYDAHKTLAVPARYLFMSTCLSAEHALPQINEIAPALSPKLLTYLIKLMQFVLRSWLGVN